MSIKLGDLERHRRLELTFDWQVFGQESLGTANDAPVDHGGQLEQLLIANLLLGLSGIAVSSSDDGYLETLSELGSCAKNAAIHEMDQREVLKQIVLNGRSRDQDSLAGLQSVQSVVSLI